MSVDNKYVDKKNKYIIEGVILKTTLQFRHDDERKKDTLNIIFEKKNGVRESIFIGTRVSPIDGAVLMMAESSEKGVL